MKIDSDIPIILASTSPRRIYLLSQIGLTVEVQRPNTEETPKHRELPAKMVVRLAREKAESVTEIVVQKHETCLVLAADTIVVAPDNRRILGKPVDVEDAKRMLRILSGKSHTVLTGYCVMLVSRKRAEKKISNLVRSKVKMRPLSRQEIDKYVATSEPMDKAGSYAAQGLGMALIEKIDGSYTNVVGLPVAQVVMDIEKKFGMSLFSWLK